MNVPHPIFHYPRSSGAVVSRREMLRHCGMGFGALALSCLMGEAGLFATENAEFKPELDLRPRSPHFPGPAKSMIMLMQTGGPSNMDLFDYKPELTKRD